MELIDKFTAFALPPISLLLATAAFIALEETLQSGMMSSAVLLSVAVLTNFGGAYLYYNQRDSGRIFLQMNAVWFVILSLAVYLFFGQGTIQNV